MDQFLVNTVWLVPCYGLFGAIATLPWSIGLVRSTGPRPAAYLNLLMSIFTLVHSLIILKTIWLQPALQIEIAWLQAPGLNLNLDLNISTVTVGASVLIGAISIFAQTYAIGSMEMDWALARFYGMMGFFEGAMSGIAISDSLFLSYALLELLTLSTYLLVGFWYAQPLVVTAARDAFWTKRIGDLILLMGVVALSSLTDSLNFSDLAVWASNVDLNPRVADLLGLALIAGPIGKCAQFPLHLWLDEAMEGPNPASILRNSVVVACGAYILIKLQPILGLSPLALYTLVAVGTVTAVGASLVAIAQIDMKRALSHSTSAHLGLVFIAVGTQQTDVALAFLFTHAIARALLFMSSGSVMMMTPTQDLTEMGGLLPRMPATSIAFIVASLGLTAILPLGNFWTILQWVDNLWEAHPWLVGVMAFVNGSTAFGLTRVFGLVFWGAPKIKTRRMPEAPWPIAIPMVSTIIITLLVPLMLSNWQMLPDRSNWNWYEVGLLVGSGAIGCLAGGAIYLRTNYAIGSTVPMLPRPVRPIWKFVQDLLAYDLYVMGIYRVSVIFLVGNGSRLISWFDRYIVDGVVNLFGFASIMTGETLKYTVTGRSQQYLLTILLGVVLASIVAFVVF
ncbi:NAD(P)H-quinone oxidoreductase subunit F [Pseudanabaena sp. PCC 6802]|uniref:NAD(P)H-quinone oxidoreductase subunit F n=1 Tax=Pseudanabaena sp. PCC 6802 TaxID=118173 RepID=UPI0003457C5B|nr:NAD(P)H-quinone oxidoreductase subunit F [Pseudanabaena sp. PCC 6802]